MTDTSFDPRRLYKLDPRAIAAVYDCFYPEVYRYILYRTGDEAIAEDFTSEVFVRLLESLWAKRGPRENLRGWLIATANHIVSDHFRLMYRSPMEDSLEVLEDEGSNLLAASQPGVEQRIEQNEMSQVFRKALSRLTTEQQHVLALRFGLGHSLEETAALMEKNINAVKTLQFRAVTALKRNIRGSK